LSVRAEKRKNDPKTDRNNGTEKGTVGGRRENFEKKESLKTCCWKKGA